MRILSVGLLYPPHHVGGYEILCKEVDDEAVREGEQVRVLVSDLRVAASAGPGAAPRGDASASAVPAGPGAAPRGDASASAVEPAGESLQVHRELRSYFTASATGLAPLTASERLAIERHNAAVLARHLDDFRPDVVGWWGMAGMSLTLIEQVRRAGVPSVFMVHDTWPDYAMRGYPWARRLRSVLPGSLAALLERPLGVPLRIDLEAAGRYLFNSEYTRDAVFASGVGPADHAILSPGVSRRFTPAPPRDAWAGRLLYIGRLDPVKGVDLLLPALAALAAETTLTIVGSGDPGYEAELRRTAAHLGIDSRVELVGSRGLEALPAIYAAADAILFPVRWEEPWGLVPMEAMAVGRPVIATARGGAASYLRHERNALVVPSEEPDEIAAAVRRLAGDPDLRRTLREGGLATVAEYAAAGFERRAVEELRRAAARGTSSSTVAPSATLT